eukprot:GILI01016699.1.p2 GENE.GILI01016699.1~~GILI01016699.1.p2  ORF type:complete len:146 (+),score=27.28 GILI01016699.1:3-440(+)
MGWGYMGRVGDTFRWKGENVSTTEVSEVVSSFPGVAEVVVYGVTVPHHEGRAGMAAIVTNGHLSLPDLFQHLKQLPFFARPLFIRLCSTFDVTSTFKFKRVEMVRQGFDPSSISDPLFFKDEASGSFVPLDPHLYTLLESGSVRL